MLEEWSRSRKALGAVALKVGAALNTQQQLTLNIHFLSFFTRCVMGFQRFSGDKMALVTMPLVTHLRDMLLVVDLASCYNTYLTRIGLF